MANDPLDERSQFDHHFRPGGEAKRVIIYHNSDPREEYALKENFERSGITKFRFKQPAVPFVPFPPFVFPPFQLSQGDVIKEENGNQWRVVKFKVRWNKILVIPTVPISFDVTTTQSPGTKSFNNTEQSMEEKPPEDRDPNIIKKGIQFAIDHTTETIVILTLTLLLVVFSQRNLVTQILSLANEIRTNNPQQESKLRVRIRLKWDDGTDMNGGSVTLLSHGGPKSLGRSNDQGYIPSVELPKENGIKFEVSHPRGLSSKRTESYAKNCTN